MAGQNNEQVEISRGELYQQVWTTPMMHLAEEYGISGPALAKICKRHKIPRPPLGYWAKKHHGITVRQLPLPPVLNRDLDMAIIHPTSGGEDERDDSLSNDFRDELNRIRRKMESVNLPARQVSTDVVRRTIRTLRSRDTRDRGLNRAWEEDCLDVSVSPENITRAGLILESLMRALQAYGYTVTTNNRGRGQNTSVQILDQKATFRLTERLRQLKQESSSSSYPYIDYEPTGRLVLEITHQYSYKGRKVWADGKKQRVEDCIQSFIEGLVRAADTERKYEERRQREHEEWLRQEEERRKLEEARRLEEQKLHQLEQEAAIWKRSQVLREYVEAVRTGLQVGLSSPALMNKDQQWLDWAMDHVNSIDPLSELKTSDFTN